MKYIMRQSPYFSKVAGHRPATLLKKTLWHLRLLWSFYEHLFLWNTSGGWFCMLLHLLCCHKCGHKFVAICCVTLSLKRSMDKWTFFHPNKRVNRATLRYRRNSFNLHFILNSNRKNKFRVLMKSKENLWIAASIFFSFFYSFFLLLFFFSSDLQ